MVIILLENWRTVGGEKSCGHRLVVCIARSTLIDVCSRLELGDCSECFFGHQSGIVMVKHGGGEN